MKPRWTDRFLVDGLWIMAFCLVVPWTLSHAQEIRRIAPDRFPEMRLGQGLQQGKRCPDRTFIGMA